MALSDHIKKDSPTNNFATFQGEYNIYHPTLSEGNTKITINSGNIHQHNIGSMIFEQGKIYYFEVATPTQSSDSQNFGIIGITKQLAAEHTGDNQNRSLFQNLAYPKLCFECRSAMVIDQTTIQDWGSSGFGGDLNLAIANFSTDSDKFIHDDTPDTSQANTLANSAAGTITPTSGNGYIPDWTHSGNKIFGILLNFTASDYGSISFTVDGTNWSTPFTKIKLNTGISWTFGVGGYAGDEWKINCGQDPTFGGLVSSSGNAPENGIGSFYYDISSTTAVALCTANLSDFTPNVDDDNPEDYFKTIKWNGSDVTAGTSGDDPPSGTPLPVGFNPDLIWIKCRNLNYHHTIYDSVRGFASDKSLIPNQSYAEATTSTGYGHLEPDGSNNVRVKNGSQSSNLWTAENERTYCAWCWKAGGAPSTDNISNSGSPGQTPTAGSVKVDGANLSGSLSSASIYPTRMSISTEQQFSITKYRGNQTVGATIGHGLNGIPDLVIIKSLGQGGTWLVYNSTIGAGRVMGLNSSAPRSGTPNAAYFNQVLPNATVVTLGYDGAGNEQNDDTDYIMYCWRSVDGFSKIGSYIGNLNPDGPFVYTGFKPAFVLLKHSTGPNQHWWIYDSTRDPINYAGRNLYANLTSTEGSYSEALDFLSNGFKIRTNSNVFNNTQTCIYMAFAEQPTKFANAR